MVQTITMSEVALVNSMTKFLGEDLKALYLETNWWHPRVKVVENWLREDATRANLPQDGLEEMIRRHIQRGDLHPHVQAKCWEHILLELRDLPLFASVFQEESTQDDIPKSVDTTSPSRGKLRPGKDLIVLSDDRSHEIQSNESTIGESEGSNASSSWSLEAMNPSLVQAPATSALGKSRPRSSASHTTRRESFNADLLNTTSAGKSFSGLSLMERQTEWLRKKQEKVEAERLRQAEEKARELTFQPKLIRRVTYSSDRQLKEAVAVPNNGRPLSRGESARRVGESLTAASAKERLLPKVPRLSHQRRSKKKIQLHTAGVSETLEVSSKLLNTMKSELEASLATARSNASSETTASQLSDRSVHHEKHEAEPVQDAEDSLPPLDNNEGCSDGPAEVEAAPAQVDQEEEEPPTWSSKPTIGGRRVDFDSTDTKARLSLQDASKFELNTMYRKTDRKAGRDGVALHVGRHEETLEEQVIAVLFDKEKVSEQEAAQWWERHEHRFADVVQKPQAQQIHSTLPPVPHVPRTTAASTR